FFINLSIWLFDLSSIFTRKLFRFRIHQRSSRPSTDMKWLRCQFLCRGSRWLPWDAGSFPYRIAVVATLALCGAAVIDAQPVVIGSKKFTESYVLGEIAKRSLSDAGISTEHRQGMGGTIILWEALRGGQIDAYPEYTGTIVEEILKSSDKVTVAQVAYGLRKMAIGMTQPLGFNNTYALVMRRNRASELGIRTISDLQKHPELKLGFTHEFLDRQDGWSPLAVAYRLGPQNVIGIDHALGYDALRSG